MLDQKQTIGGQLSDNANRFADRDALIFPGNCRYTWQQLDAEVVRVARALLAAGVGRGTHLGLWAPNRPEWILLFLASARIGAVVVAFDTALQGPEFSQQLADSDVELLFIAAGVKGQEYLDVVGELLPDSDRFPKLRRTLLFGESGQEIESFSRFVQAGESIAAAQLATATASVSAADLVNIQYTSAAFGTPKGVMLSQAAILHNGAITGDNLGFGSDDCLCLPLPLFHAFGCSLGLMLCLAHAATLVVLERFDPEAVLQVVADEGCTALHGVPTMFLAVLEAERFGEFDLSSLRTGIMAGAPCPVELMLDVIDKMQAPEVTIAYGQTQAGPLITQTPRSDSAEVRVATVGLPLAGVAVKIVDPVTGAEQPDGAEGELCARGPMLMRGYYKQPEATAADLDADGWLHTGDLALRDDAGRFRITGRLRNMIIRGGQNVYPAEVETCLLQHPQISAVKVFGQDDRKLGEIVAARIVAAAEDLTADEVRSFCQGRLAPYKIPVAIEFVPSL